MNQKNVKKELSESFDKIKGKVSINSEKFFGKKNEILMELKNIFTKFWKVLGEVIGNFKIKF